MINRESVPLRAEGVLRQRASGTVILLHLDHGEYYSLNEVGGRVWDLCDGAHSVAEIVSLLCEEYEAPAEAIEADVIELLADLAHEKLVAEAAEVAAGAATPP